MTHFVTEGISQDFADMLRSESEAKLSSDGNMLAVFFGAGDDVKPVVLCTAPTNETFCSVLRGDYSGCLEVNEANPMEDAVDQLTGLISQGAWFASFSSQSVFKSEFVDGVSDRIAAEHNVEKSDRDLMRTALDEAILNGVIHGNLELMSPHMVTIDDFADFYATIDARITVPEYGLRHVTVQTWTDANDICVSVTDEGPGYTPFRENRKAKSDTSKFAGKDRRRNGRGLEIIRNLTKRSDVDLDGQRITMRF